MRSIRQAASRGTVLITQLIVGIGMGMALGNALAPICDAISARIVAFIRGGK